MNGVTTDGTNMVWVRENDELQNYQLLMAEPNTKWSQGSNEAIICWINGQVTSYIVKTSIKIQIHLVEKTCV
jgi:hypothetical protein